MKKESRITPRWLLIVTIAAVLSATVFAVQAEQVLCPCGCGAALADVQWESWTGTVDADGGHYRMEADYLYAQTEQITIAEGCDVVLDLNGHTYAVDDTRIFYMTAGGKLTILDTAGGGEMMSTGKEKAAGGLIYSVGGQINLAGGTLRGPVNDQPVTYGGVMNLTAGSVFNMTGGTVTGGYTSNDGGNICMDASTFTMRGGTVENGISGNRGGNLLIGANCTFEMSGGTIKGGQAAKQGGNIRQNYSTSTVTISGGTIYGDMTIFSAKSFTLSGSPKILMGNSAGLILGDGIDPTAGNSRLKLTLEDLNTDAEIYISAVGEVTDAAAAEYLDCFKGALRTTVTANAETGILEATQGTTGYCPHCWQAGAPATWTDAGEISQASSGTYTTLKGDAHYYLTGDITRSGNGSRLNIGQSSTADVFDIVIDLAGCDWTTTNNRVAQVFDKMTVMDTIGGGTMSGAIEDGYAAVAFVNTSASEFDLYSGKLQAYDGAANTVIGGGSCVIRIHGGEIAGSTVSDKAGCISSYSDDSTMKLYISGGLLRGGSTEANGGNLLAGKKSQVTISSGVITGGSAQEYGGNIHVAGKLEYSGGTVANGTAQNLGGNIYASGTGTINMSGGFVYGGQGNTETKYNSTTYKGDNICVSAGTMVFSGGTVLNAENTGTDSKINKGNAVLGWGAAKLTLDGNARTLNGKNAGNIYVGGTTQLTVNSGFAGCVSAVFRTADDRHATTPVYGTVLENGFSQGSYAGTLVMEGDYGQPNVYATADNLLIAAGIALTDGKTFSWYPNGAAADAAYENGKYIKFFADGALPMTGDRLVDLNGHTVTVTGSGELSGFDTSNDDYDGCGTAVVTDVQVSSSVKAPNNGNYIAITDENGTSFHRMGLRVSGISLRPSAAGIYYQASWQCDEALQAKIKNYGVAVSLEDMPRADFASDADTLWTNMDPAGFVSGQAKTSAIIADIFSADAADNDTRGRCGIFAAPYVVLDDGTEAGMTVIGDDGNAVAGGVCYSFYDVMREVNRMWPSLNETQKSGVNALYDTFVDVLEPWDMYNIVAEREGTYEDRSLKILTIGHSLAVDANHLLAKVAQAEGTTDITVGTLYYSGCRIYQHVDYMENNTPAYVLYMSDMSTATADQPPTKIANSTMLDGILAADWDIIVMQMGPFENITSPTLNEDIQAIMDYVNANKTNPEAVFAWHMWWAFPEDATLLETNASTLPQQFMTHFECNQMAMYENMVADTQARIEPDSRFVYVIPTGTAIQNANSSYLTDLDIYRDYCHASDLSRVIAAYTWYCTVTGKTVDELALDAIPAAMTNSYTGEGDMVLTEQQKLIIVEAVRNAIANPYAVTQSQYTTEG